MILVEGIVSVAHAAGMVADKVMRSPRMRQKLDTLRNGLSPGRVAVLTVEFSRVPYQIWCARNSVASGRHSHVDRMNCGAGRSARGNTSKIAAHDILISTMVYAQTLTYHSLSKAIFTELTLGYGTGRSYRLLQRTWPAAALVRR